MSSEKRLREILKRQQAREERKRRTQKWDRFLWRRRDVSVKR